MIAFLILAVLLFLAYAYCRGRRQCQEIERLAALDDLPDLDHRDHMETRL